MANIAIVGKSGTGKSTSYGQLPEIGIKGLNPKETVIINVTGKELRFRNWREFYKDSISENGNYLETSDASIIIKAIKFISDKKTDIKNIVIDDAQYIMAFEFMARAKEKSYEKYNDIGNKMYKLTETARTSRRDLDIYFLWHPELDGNLEYKMKTIGKMVDNYLTLEGLFTVILYTKVIRDSEKGIIYQFVTNNDGEYPANTPVGMFKDLYIPNDLGYVSEKIHEYYNINQN